MNKESFVKMPIDPLSVPIDPEASAEDVLHILCTDARKRHDPELISKLCEAQGLYLGFDMTKQPELADAVIQKLGLIIDYLLTKSSFDPYSAFLKENQTDIIYFIAQQKEKLNQNDRRIMDVNEFVEQFDRYLVLQGKKEQTRKIYRGKVKAVFANCNIELPIRITDFEAHLREISMCYNTSSKRDHNLNSTISNLLNYIRELLSE